jgi:hypothetical protein
MHSIGADHALSAMRFRSCTNEPPARLSGRAAFAIGESRHEVHCVRLMSRLVRFGCDGIQGAHFRAESGNCRHGTGKEGREAYGMDHSLSRRKRAPMGRYGGFAFSVASGTRNRLQMVAKLVAPPYPPSVFLLKKNLEAPLGGPSQIGPSDIFRAARRENCLASSAEENSAIVFWDLPLIDTVARPAAGIDAIHQGCNLLLMGSCQIRPGYW